jgi:hypothetical protein
VSLNARVYYRYERLRTALRGWSLVQNWCPGPLAVLPRGLVDAVDR